MPPTTLSHAPITARRASWLRRLLIAGALIDLGGATGFTVLTGKTIGLTDLPLADEFWTAYASVFLVVLAMFYGVTAIDPLRSIANVGVAIIGRFLGALIYFWYAWPALPKYPVLVIMAAMNAGLAIAYLYTLGRAGRQHLYAALRPPEARSKS